ncbi:hypothetical protein DL93DRAFT_396093 [Clavulina sp. PMI_390]|nr:hypothetical protein DL93DRAFT_396093 [Clavulina sp. PMI_390]
MFFLRISKDAQRTSMRLKITWHRVQSTAILLSLCIAKAVMGLRGSSVVGAAMDWALGVFLALSLYWIGLYESVWPAKVAPYFHHDLLTGNKKPLDINPEEFLDHKDNYQIIDRYRSWGVAVTGYRILTTAVLLAIGSIKFAFTLHGKASANTLEWIIGIILALLIYWLGFFEPPKAKGWSPFFHVDYSSSIENLIMSGILFLIPAVQVFGLIVLLLIFTAHQIIPHPLDNKVDIACRVLCILWFSYAGLLILQSFMGRASKSKSLWPDSSTFDELIALGMISWVPLVLIGAIKAGWGRELDSNNWIDSYVQGWWRTMKQMSDSGLLVNI